MSEFITKDSGERKVFDSGMQRDTEAGKEDYTLAFDGPMFKRWVALLDRGAKKYNPKNWQKAKGPEERERFRRSACRHFFQWLFGEKDEDHAAAVFFNINGVEYIDSQVKEEPELTRALIVSQAVKELQTKHSEEIAMWRYDRLNGHEREPWCDLIKKQADAIYEVIKHESAGKAYGLAVEPAVSEKGPNWFES